MKTRQKLKNCHGFTLAETLLAVLIMLLVSVIVATGIPAAKNAYEKVIVASNGQVLLSTAATALRDELGTAWNIEIYDDTGEKVSNGPGESVIYYSADTGALSKIGHNEDEGILLQEYIKASIFNVADGNYLNDKSGSYIPDGKGRRLVAEKAGPGDSSGNLIVNYDSVCYSEDCVIFTNLNVGSKSYPNLASIESLSIPVLSASI